VLFPLVGMGLCACLILFLRDLSVGNIGEISVGLFIGLIGYVISYRQFVPETASISRADWVLFSTAVIVLAQLLFIIAGNVRYHNAGMETARTILLLRIMSCLISLLYAVSVIYIVFS
jgi:hypothetical protein